MSHILQYFHYSLFAEPVRMNGYLLYALDCKEAAMIDPGGEPERILEKIREMNLTLKYILLTHGHFDHISGVYALQKATGALICMNKKDAHFITDSEWNAVNLVKCLPVVPFSVEHDLEDGETLYLGTHALHVLATPGHTPGEMSFYIPGHLFCGDTILKGTIGRWDLLGADVEQSVESIRKKIFPLPDDTVIHCGHGEESTVKYEKQYNRFVGKNNRREE